MYSCQTSLQQGQPLFPNSSNNQAQTILELDLISSYGSAASRLNHQFAPGGFGQAYRFDQHQLQPCDRVQRHHTFEFKTVYAILHMLQAHAWTIRSAFHNYSLLGLITLEHCPIDLVVVAEKQVHPFSFPTMALFLFQVDGIYIHGCPLCPPLPVYVGQQTHEEVREKTTQRDAKLLRFVAAFRTCFPHWLVDYIIVRDCHSDYFPESKIHDLFQSIKALHQLQAPYTLLKHYMKCTPIPHILEQCPKDLTYIAICQVQLKPKSQSFLTYLGGEFFWWGSNNNNNNHQGWYFSNHPQHNVLMTKSLYVYLTSTFEVSILHIDFILFFRTCPFLSQTYDRFIEQRQQAALVGQGLVQLFFKRVINLSTGYFAMSGEKQPSKRSPRTFSIHSQLCKQTVLNRCTFFYPLGCVKNVHFHLRSKPCSMQHKTSIYLPYYICIIEEAKRRLHECLYGLSAWSQPFSIRLMYSNTDNLILALTKATLQECQTLDATSCNNSNLLITTSHQPGCLELKWTTTHLKDWIFISPKLCSYIVLDGLGQDGFAKFTSLNQCSLQDLFRIAQTLLSQQPCIVTQQRRQHKLIDRSIISVQYILQ